MSVRGKLGICMVSIKKSGMNEKEYSVLITKLLEYVNLIADEKILENLNISH